MGSDLSQGSRVDNGGHVQLLGIIPGPKVSQLVNNGGKNSKKKKTRASPTESVANDTAQTTATTEAAHERHCQPPECMAGAWLVRGGRRGMSVDIKRFHWLTHQSL